MEQQLIVKRSILVNADNTTVWEALTNPEQTKKYMFNCEVASDWQVGSPITWQGNFQGYEAFQKGTILQCIPGKLVQYTTFDPNFDMADLPENYLHVTYELHNRDGKTELTITNENFGGDEKRCEHTAMGWDNMIIPKLKELLEHS